MSPQLEHIARSRRRLMNTIWPPQYSHPDDTLKTAAQQLLA
jgi:hypothetical protein